jgi:hypothetical protein
MEFPLLGYVTLSQSRHIHHRIFDSSRRKNVASSLRSETRFFWDTL